MICDISIVYTTCITIWYNNICILREHTLRCLLTMLTDNSHVVYLDPDAAKLCHSQSGLAEIQLLGNTNENFSQS